MEENNNCTEMSLFEWTKNSKDWEVNCPLCGKKINLNPGKGQCGGLSIEKLKCTNDGCRFEVNTSWIWFKIKSSKLVDELLSKVPDYDIYKAWEWVNNFKYNNPTYQISEKNERNKSLSELSSIITKTATWNNDGKILCIGCNSGYELLALSSSNNNGDIKTIVSVDVSKNILESGLKENYRVVKEKCGEKIEFLYCQSYVEKLEKSLKCFTVCSNGQSYSLSADANREYGDCDFDLVLALKLFQSSYFEDISKLRQSLIRISEKMRSNATLIISIPKATCYIPQDQTCLVNNSSHKIEGETKVNFISGIYQPNGFVDGVDSLKFLDKLVQEVLFLGEFINISVYYGNEKSYEYYITCKKR